MESHIELLTSQQIDYTEVSEEAIKKASTLQLNQTALAVVEIPDYPPLDISDYPYLPLFEGLQDPGNFGTILRICDWYGIKAVVLSNDSVDVFNPKVIQASMGSFLRIRVYYMDVPDLLAKNDRPVVGTVIDGENIHQFHWPDAGVLVFGNESHGISDRVLRQADHLIAIPRFGEAESLNVAVSTAVVFDNLFRKIQ